MDNCLGNCEWCRDTRSATVNKQLWSLTLCQSIFAFYFILQWHMKWKIIKFNEKFLHASQHCNTNRFSLDSRIWFKRNSMPVQCRLNGTLAVYFDFFFVWHFFYSVWMVCYCNCVPLILKQKKIQVRLFSFIWNDHTGKSETQTKIDLNAAQCIRGIHCVIYSIVMYPS